MRRFILSFFALALGTVVLGQCHAGNDVNVELCGDAAPLDLFDRITGLPMNNGFWLDPSDVAFTNPFDPQVHAGGMYKYIVDTELDGTVCALSDTAFVNVSIHIIPLVTFSLDDNEGCGELAAQFNNTSVAPGFTSCSWDFGDGGTSFSCAPLHNYSDTGCFDVTLTLSDGLGCTASSTVMEAACVNEAPTAYFELEENPILTTDPVAVIVDGSTAADAYEYSVPGVGNFSEPAPEINLPALEETYFSCLQVMADNGCTDTYCTNIIVRDELLMYVPTAFTPDLDKVNDHFRPTLTFDPQFYELRVYDRWGNEIFYSDTPEQGWNGAVNLNGQQGDFFASDSFYTYKIRVVKDGTVLERMGQVTVIR